MDPKLSRVPTMFINDTNTTLSRVDPLKGALRGLFKGLPSPARGHVVAVLGEFIGTLSFVFFAFAGVQVGAAASNKEQGVRVSTAASAKSPQLLLYASLAAGFSLTVHAWTFFRISGGLFNPVISFGMALIGAITWARCALLCVTQTAATIAASYLVRALFNGGLNVATELGGGTTYAQGVIIEMILTAQLAFTVFMLAAEQHPGTFLAPIGIGLSYFIAELVGIFWTGGSVNPARSLAPCIVNRSFTSYHWIYWVGPIAGVILAVLIFKLVKALEYETCNGEEREQSKQLLPQANKNQTPVASLASVRFSLSSSRIAIISGQKIPSPAPVQTSQNLKLTPSSVKQNENSSLPECYADGAGDYRELNSSVCLLSPAGVTLQAISPLDGNKEIDEANSTATPLSPAGSAVVQPNSSSSGNAASGQASSINNTDENVEQGRDGYNIAEKVEQGRGCYNAVEKVEQGRGGYTTDETADNTEPQQVKGASTDTQETITIESTGDSAEAQPSTEDYNSQDAEGSKEAQQGSAGSNTDQKIEQGRGACDTAEKIEQVRGGCSRSICQKQIRNVG